LGVSRISFFISLSPIASKSYFSFSVPPSPSRPHHPRAPRPSTPSTPPRLTRSYSRLASNPSQTRLTSRSTFASRYLLRTSSLVRHSSTTAPAPHASKPLPPWNQPTADMHPREVPWIFSFVWKGLKVYARSFLPFSFLSFFPRLTFDL